ncbi:hypothetical protein HZY62_16520 [Maribacter polysiphoniae]|uniref:Putative esterase n=1 Tax=Maribacter polysiphoniae TaxID=429344 RepID=A0A316DW00_9FLAO|nr:alpha/beta hydrolase-fold protein [Maribacter polysiphoniae]MBD1262207.1 hypothetical protein [Maribacter polysiphoniae]PWK21532.1 putative esterase [Maribacter polysiphoniae]
MQYGIYKSKELVSKIYASYNTRATNNNRAISVLSMGGHRALYLAFRHTDIWGVAGSMSGDIDIRQFLLRWDISERLGPYAENPGNWENNTIINLVHLLMAV